MSTHRLDRAAAARAVAPAVIVAALIYVIGEVSGAREEGWKLAGTIVPIAYVAWSIWLIAIGAGLLLGW